MAVVEPNRTLPRASRSGPVKSQRIVPQATGDDCGKWGLRRTRAQSDACWQASVARWSDWDLGRVLRIIYCESHGDSWSIGGGRYVGLMQIEGAFGTQGDGPANIALGHEVWLRGGYSRWQCK